MKAFVAAYEGVTHAGVLPVARDTGKIFLAQRAFDETDDEDVRETWEIVGGTLESGEDPQIGAWREFHEEIGRPLGDLEVVHGWRSGDRDHYQGFVVLTPRETHIDPSEPDPTEVQAVGWFTLEEARGLNLRPEVASTDLEALVETALNEEVSGNEAEVEEVEDDLTDDDFVIDDLVTGPIKIHGVLAPEGVESGDGREFAEYALTRRSPLRLPFNWQKSALSGHDGSVVVGSIDVMMRGTDGLIHWEGELLPTEEASELIDLLVHFGKFGVSIDGDKASMNNDVRDKMLFDAARIAGATACAIPAFQEAYVALGPHPSMPTEPTADVMVAGARAVALGPVDAETEWIELTGTLVAWSAQSNSVQNPSKPEGGARCTTCAGAGTVMFTTSPEDTETLMPTLLTETPTPVGSGTGISTVTATDGTATRWHIGFSTKHTVDQYLLGLCSTTFAGTSLASTLPTLSPSKIKRTSTGGYEVMALCASCVATGSTTSPTLPTSTSGRVQERGLAFRASERGSDGPMRSVSPAALSNAALQEFKRGKGWVTHPKQTSRIHRYWTEPGQPGYAKIRWGTPGDWTRCTVLVGEKIAKNSPEKMRYIKQICSQWHNDALGYWPGEYDRPGNPSSKTKAASAPEGLEFDAEGHGWEAVLTSSAKVKAHPPLAYFHRHPDTGALTVEEPDEFGIQRVHGYAAQWGVCHVGMNGVCVEPPIAGSDDYPDFHLGRTRTAEGFVPTGVLTYGVGHRDAEQILSESPDQAYFDNTNNAWAAVRVGEDEKGIWFSGVVLPGVPDDHLTKISASGQVSGEWLRGEMRACLTVNVPGFPVAQPSVTYDDSGNVMALAASAFGQAPDAPCTPSPAERMEALRQIDAEVRFQKLREAWVS